MKIKRLVSLGSATILSLSSLLTLAVPLAHAAVQTCQWTGATDLKFSTATNWNNCGGGVPLAGDIIQIDQPTTGTTNLTNDLGYALGGVIAGQTTTGGYYRIDTLSLTAGAALSILSTTDCAHFPVNIEVATLTAAGALTVNIGAFTLDTFTINGDVTLQSNNGFGSLAGQSSSVSGNVIVASPVSSTTATCTHGGGGGNAGGSPDALTGFTVHGLTVQNGASITLGDSSFPISLGGGSGTGAPELMYYANLNSNTLPVDTTYTVASPITLTNDAKVYASDKATVNFTGTLSGAGKTLTMDQLTEGTVNYAFTANDSNTKNGIQQNPAQTITIAASDSSTQAETVVGNETLVLDGTRGFEHVSPYGKLMGTGTATNGIYVLTGGIIAPGHSPGCLNSGNLTLNGTYQAEIGGTDPCTGYDQIKVTGTVDVTGGTLQATLYNGFVPKVGQSYTIISNDGTDAVTGTFNGLAEGATYTNQGVTYSVTYKGGDGNDVVLTVTKVDTAALPKTPNTGMKLVAAHPMVALGFTTGAALFMAYTARRMRPAPARSRARR